MTLRDFDAVGARALQAGGIKVDNPDVAGPKTGDLTVSIGVGKGSATYDVSNVPVAFTAKGKSMELSGAGRTTDGIALKITATCAEITSM